MKFEIRPSSHPAHPAFPGDRLVEVGECFVLVPEGIEPSGHLVRDGRIPIRLSRGKAFGSGLHETTASCIEALEGLPALEDSSVLDVGTGTGILSLGALLLGARTAVAFDIEWDAAWTCKRNSTLNRMDGRLTVFQGTFEALNPSFRCDIVLANIYGDIILKEADRLSDHTREGGYLVLSGLDYTDSRAVKSAMRKQGMEEVSVLFLEDFVTQVWHCPQSRDRKEP